MSELPAVAELLPHGPEALCLDATTAYEPGLRAAARIKVRPGLWLYDDALDGIPAWAGIEIMAQTLGIYVGMDARAKGRGPRLGYLIGLRHFSAARPLFANGLELDATAKCLYSEQDEIGHFDCRILAEAEELARADLVVWRPRSDELQT